MGGKILILVTPEINGVIRLIKLFLMGVQVNHSDIAIRVYWK